MTCLNIRIEYDGINNLHVECDLLRREDATGTEVEIAKQVEAIVESTFRAVSEKVIAFQRIDGPEDK